MAKRARTRALAQVVSIDFAFSAFSVLPYDVTISIPDMTVIMIVAITRILRMVFAIDPPKDLRFFSVVLLSFPAFVVILFELTHQRNSLALKIKPVLMRLSQVSGGSPASTGLKILPSDITIPKKNRAIIERSERKKYVCRIAKKDIFLTLAYIWILGKISPL